MKVRVITEFIDKITREAHRVGEVLDLADKARVADLVDRHLVVEIETPKPKKKK